MAGLGEMFKLRPLVKLFSSLRLPILQRYLLKNFFSVALISLLASSSLFLVFDLFERISVFIKEDTSAVQIFQYLLYKLPLILQLMTPLTILIAVLISIGRLSQLSEITAMRAAGLSVWALARPLLFVGILISGLMFANSEWLVPASSRKLHELYNLDIKKKAEKGSYSKSNFWYRKDNRFISVGLYDSRTASLQEITVLEMNKDFQLDRRTDAKSAVWGGSKNIGWTMNDIVEILINSKGQYVTSQLKNAPLIIDEQPSDFFQMEKTAEAMSYAELGSYIEKLKTEGVSTSAYLVDLAAKLSFPLLSFIVVLLAFPLALISSRSGSLTKSAVAGAALGFLYYVTHAISLSFGKAELIPPSAAAWTANIIFLSLGTYLMAGTE